jgi:hypothetical protein
MYKLLAITLLVFAPILFYGRNEISTTDSVPARRSFYRFSVGYSVPMGSYGAQDKRDKKSGFAGPGLRFLAGLDWLKRGSFGISLQYSYQRNPLQDPSTLVYPNGFPAGTDPGAWNNHYIMLGPVFRHHFDKFFIMARLMAGGMVSYGSTFNTPDPTDTTGMSSHTNLAGGLAWSAGGEIGYHFPRGPGVTLTLDVMGGWPGKTRQYPAMFIGWRPYYNPVTGIVEYESVYTSPVEYEIKKVVTAFTIGIGVVFPF